MITNKTTAKAVVIITVAVLCDKCVHFVFSPFNSLSSLFVITRMSSRMKLLFLMLLFFFYRPVSVLATICQGVSIESSCDASCTYFEPTSGRELFKALLLLERSNLSWGGS